MSGRARAALTRKVLYWRSGGQLKGEADRRSYHTIKTQSPDRRLGASGPVIFCVSGSRRGGVTADVDFALALARAGDVVGRLHPHQRFHFRAESLFDPYRHIAGQVRLTVEQDRQRRARNAEGFGGSGHGKAERLDNFRADKFAGGGGGRHTTRFLPPPW